MVERFLAGRQYAEIWLSQGTAKALSLLVNRDLAWIMYLVNIDEQCWHSVESRSSGASDATLEFVLANGQRDEYPASWAVPTEQALSALECFFLRQERSPALSWLERGERIGTRSRHAGVAGAPARPR